MGHILATITPRETADVLQFLIMVNIHIPVSVYHILMKLGPDEIIEIFSLTGVRLMKAENKHDHSGKDRKCKHHKSRGSNAPRNGIITGKSTTKRAKSQLFIQASAPRQVDKIDA